MFTKNTILATQSDIYELFKHYPNILEKNKEQVLS